MVSRTNRSRMTVAVAVLLASLIVAAPVLAAQSIGVQKYTASGCLVQVSVKNYSGAPASGTVAVQAVVNGISVWSFVPVVLAPGQCASVSAGFTGPVQSVGSVSLTDDPSPF